MIFNCIHSYSQRLEPSERLGSDESGGMCQLKQHSFFSEHDYNTKWGNLLNESSPLQTKEKLSSRPKKNS